MVKNLLKLNKEQYGFVNDKVELIMTSDITGHYENPDGIFKCENIKCDNDSSPIRYKPRPGEIVPDSIPCPVCGKNMVNYGLEVLWAQSSQKIKRISSGTPEQYQASLNALDIFLRLYKAEQAKKWPYPEVPSLTVTADIASKIFDDQAISKINSALEEIKVRRELKLYVANEIKHREIYENFYSTLTPGKVFKQTDLIDDFKTLNPRANIDPTWIFYIWSNFGLVKRTKEKNRVYLERITR